MSCITQRALVEVTLWPSLFHRHSQAVSVRCGAWGRYSNLPSRVPLTSFKHWLRSSTFTLCLKFSRSFSRHVVHAHDRFLLRRIFARAFSTPPEVKRNKKNQHSIINWLSMAFTVNSASCNMKRIKLNNKVQSAMLGLPDNCSLHWHCHKDEENNYYNRYSNSCCKVRGCGCFCVELVNVPWGRMQENEGETNVK